eukprot:jgi/Chlat1/9127/Chrsp97S08388
MGLPVDTCGLGQQLTTEACALLAMEAEYRLREVIQEALKLMRHSKRSTVRTDDVNQALRLRNAEALYGFSSSESVKFKQAIGSADVYYIEDNFVEFSDITEAPLPKVPVDVSIVPHWLAIEGVQPAIPENAPLHDPASVPPPAKKPKAEGTITVVGEDGVPREIKPAVKHVLSQELQLYYEKIVQLLRIGHGPLFRTALTSLATDPGLAQLLPYFTQFVTDEVTRNLRNVPLLLARMQCVRSLLENPHLHVEPYLHQLMPPIITCIVARRLGSKAIDNHWGLRDYAASLIAFVCNRYGHAYQDLQPRVTRTLVRTFLDPSRAMTQHYGAIVGLAALGSRVVQLLVLPNMAAYVQLLREEMTFETQKNEVKRYEASRCYGAIQHAAGICMYKQLAKDPRWAELAARKPRASVLRTGAGMVRLAMANTARRKAQSQDRLDVAPSGEDQSASGQPAGTSNNTQAAGLSVSAATALQEAWRTDADPGSLLEPLFKLFGEGVLPYVPSTLLASTFV